MSTPRRRKRAGRRRRRGRRWRRGLGALLLAATLGVATVLLWLLVLYPRSPGPGAGRSFELMLEPDASLREVAAELDAHGALQRPAVWVLYARVRGASDRLREGRVLLTDDMSPRDLLRRLARGFGEASVRVTIPEGFDRFAVAQRLAHWGVCDADDFVAATEDRLLLLSLNVRASSAEGYLFPDTYRFETDSEPAAVIRRFVANFDRRVGPLFAESSAPVWALTRSLRWERQQVIIVASIVEREAVMADERPIIARVFINRLIKEGFSPRRLQADPTVVYGCRRDPRLESCRAFDGHRITRAMLHGTDNVYNTYRHDGLPPGPISNPGLASIRAVLHPDRNDFLYFVARGHGRHAFSTTLEEHNRAVARYRAHAE